MLGKYNKEASDAIIEKWLNRKSSQIESYLDDTNEMVDCIETFYAITAFDYITIKEAKEQAKIILPFIEKIFDNISEEKALYVLKEWYKKFSFEKADVYEVAQVILSSLDSRISNKIKSVFLLIDNKLLLGYYDALRKFSERMIYKWQGKVEIYDIEDKFLSVAILHDCSRLIIYDCKESKEEEIEIAKVVDCWYKASQEKIQMAIITKVHPYSSLVIETSEASEFEKVREIYQKIIGNIKKDINKSVVTNECASDKIRLQELKDLFDLNLITEEEYEEKKKEILEQI